MAEVTLPEYEIDQDRIVIVRKASWEIEALAALIIRELTSLSEATAARSMAVRIKQLSCIQMGALTEDDPRESVEELRHALTGLHQEQEARHA